MGDQTFCPSMEQGTPLTCEFEAGHVGRHSFGPTYELTTEDMAIIEATAGQVAPADKPRIVQIHERHLSQNRQRRDQLVGELRAVERAILMREAALDRIQRLSETEGREDG